VDVEIVDEAEVVAEVEAEGVGAAEIVVEGFRTSDASLVEYRRHRLLRWFEQRRQNRYRMVLSGKRAD
jgi:hypothetical protein